ncbi:MAG: hypothetical protein ACYTEQ_25545 [Planctomycetota bacterium]|jgi:hypothetical protein
MGTTRLVPARVNVKSFEETRLAFQRHADAINRLTVGDLVTKGALGEGGAAGTPTGKGDILVSDVDQVFNLLKVGADGAALVLNSAQALGVEWTAPTPAAHTIASHSDTTGTGPELDTLTDGSDADALHTHGTSVTAAAVIADNALVRGDGGGRGVQGPNSAWTLSDADLLAAGGDLQLDGNDFVGGASGVFQFRDSTGGDLSVQITATAGDVNYLALQGGSTTKAPILRAIGSDTHVDLDLRSQGADGVIVLNAPLKMAEVAAAYTDTAAYGQWWTKSDVPCTPWFTNDVGTDFQLASLAGTETLTNKTLTTPTIGDFTNAAHDHADAAGGATLNASVIAAGTLAHERGGVEADISAVAIGDFIVGTGAGTMGLVTSAGHNDGDVMTRQADGSADWEAPAGGGGGETNTASNQGTDGVGVYDTKVGVDLQFRHVAPASTKITTVLNGKDIDIDVVPGNIKLDDLGAPDDNTDLDATSTKHGLLKKLGTIGTVMRSTGTAQQWSSQGSILEPYFVAIDTPTKLAWNTHLTSGGLPVSGIGIDDNLSGTATLYLAFRTPSLYPGGTPYIALSAISSEALKSLDFTVSWECDTGGDLDALSLDAEAALTLDFLTKADIFVEGTRELDAGSWTSGTILYMKIDIADADPPTNIVTLLVPKIIFTN